MELADAIALLLGEIGDVSWVDFDGSLDWSIIDKALFLFRLDGVFLGLVKVCLAIDFLLFQSVEVTALSSDFLEGLGILYGCHYTSY